MRKVGHARVPAWTRKARHDGLVFTAVPLQIGGILGRYTESVVADVADR
jgi:hypothetical protein